MVSSWALPDENSRLPPPGRSATRRAVTLSKLNEKEIRHVALLSRLAITDREVRTYTEQLGKILRYVEKLNELDTANVKPMITAAAGGNIFREDEPRPSLDNEQALQSSPDHDGAYFRVPPIIT